MSSVGKRIRECRLAQRMTLEDVAQKIGLTRQTVSRYETGAIEKIPPDMIVKLAAILQTTPGYLLGWPREPDQVDILTLSLFPDLVPGENYIPGTDQGVKDHQPTESNGDIMALREKLRTQPGMRTLFDAAKGATEQDLLDAAALIEGFKRRRDGEE